SLAPLKSFVLLHDVDKTLGPRRVVAINQQAGDIGNVARFKSITEEQDEERWQNQKQEQHSFVAINVEKLLVGDAEDGVKRGVHELGGKHRTPNTEHRTPNKSVLLLIRV